MSTIKIDDVAFVRRDPWGRTLEHWTDGEPFTASDGSNVASLRDLLGVQWGPPAPPTMA